MKELYYYLDSTPTHSYMRALYKYPQAAFPYDQLVEENARRSVHDDEYELLDTGTSGWDTGTSGWDTGTSGWDTGTSGWTQVHQWAVSPRQLVVFETCWHASGKVGRLGGNQADRHAGREGGRQTGRHAGG